MQHNYELYRPQRMIQDVYDTSRSYYHAPDIAFGPGSTIGSLLAQSAREGKTTADAVHLSANSAVFAGNFKLIQPDEHSDTHHIPVRKRMSGTEDTKPAAMRVAPEKPLALSAGMLSAAWAGLVSTIQHARFAPKKYSLERGLHSNYSTPTFTMAKVSGPFFVALSVVVVLLMASLNPGGIIQKYGFASPFALHSHSRLQPALFVATTHNSAGSSTDSTPAAGNGARVSTTSYSPHIAVPVSTAQVGGMGGGPIGSTSTSSQPVTANVQPVIDPVTTIVTNPTTPVVAPTTDTTQTLSDTNASGALSPVIDIVQPVTQPITTTLTNAL